MTISKITTSLIFVLAISAAVWGFSIFNLLAATGNSHFPADFAVASWKTVSVGDSLEKLLPKLGKPMIFNKWPVPSHY
jgi:hypothetical protein